MVVNLIRPVPGHRIGELQLKLPRELQFLLQNLDLAQRALDGAARSYPLLRAPSRAIRHLARTVARPFRIAVLGESNSGKSSIANLLTGGMTLPALPIANTRLPTLLYYAPAPELKALHASGRRFALSSRDQVLDEDCVRLEVGLPSAILGSIEILDFPGSANPLYPARPNAAVRHGIDAAIWATVATHAWRETERLAWAGLPARIRSRGVLAVTHCDLVATPEDFRKLKARLQGIAVSQFSALCFVAAGNAAAAVTPAETDYGADLSTAVSSLSRQFAADRGKKALLVARRLATQTLSRIEAENS